MYLLLINIIIPSIRGGVFDECGYIIICNVTWIIAIIEAKKIQGIKACWNLSWNLTIIWYWLSPVNSNNEFDLDYMVLIEYL